MWFISFNIINDVLEAIKGKDSSDKSWKDRVKSILLSKIKTDNNIENIKKVIILVGIGVPVLVTVGYLHYKRSPAYRSESGIMQETNPYARRNLINSEMNLQINLEVLKIIIELSRNGKIEKTQMDKILKLKDELANYHASRSFTGDTDMKYLRRLQKT